MSRQRQAGGKRTQRRIEQTFAEASFRNALKEKMKCDQVTTYEVITIAGKQQSTDLCAGAVVMGNTNNS